MNRQTLRSAFTLIELLTVMAIITLLIGILTPALSASRNRATKTAIKAQINSMSAGLEAFKSDEGEFPASNANLMANDPTVANAAELGMPGWEVSGGGGPSGNLQGAHLLVDAMVGRDFLGYDPRAAGVNNSSTYDRWDPTNDRREPYIPVDGVSVTSDIEPATDGDGIIPTPAITFPMIDQLDVPVFKDKFGWPILYYRASPSANQNTPITTTTNSPFTTFGDGVYDGFDNEDFTSYNNNTFHRITDANMALTFFAVGTSYNAESLENLGTGGVFAEFIRSIRATSYDQGTPRLIFRPRPVKPDRFIILSAGKDGIYGNLDDVANFEVQSINR